MKAKICSQSGFLGSRSLAAFTLGSVGVLLAMLSFAADPASSMPLALTRPAWSIVTSPNTSSKGNYLSDVTCTSVSDCWAVGFYTLPGYIAQTLIEHWNGTTWSIVTSPNASTTQDNGLHGVTCASASDCWAVGDTLIEHWNGTAWSIAAAPNAGELSGITCTTASDCWGVGSYRVGLYSQTLIEHWNGKAWSIVTSPNTSSTQLNSLSRVTCTSASNCWAVGDYYNFSIIRNQPHHTLIEHWNGAAWSIVTSPNASDTFNTLSDVTCTSASDCWAIGAALIEHWNGIAWSIVNWPGATHDDDLHDVTCASASDCWAVGSSFNGDAWETLTAHWNGTRWSIASSPNNATVENYLNGVTCASASDCWAVGYYWDYGDNAYHTLIERYTPTPTLTNTSTRLQVLTGDNVLISGLIIDGSDSMTVLFRALGPTLSAFNVPGVLADPTLELHTTDNLGHDVVVATNDNWRVDDQTHQSQQAAITATGIAPHFDSESAILRTLAPGSYTLIVRGKNNGTGVALVEAYDVSTGANSELLNISSRGFVNTNANVMIDGFIVGSPSNFLVRAVGPTLGAPPFNIAGAMTDPTLELHMTDNMGHDVVVATNDNWKVDDQTHQSQQAVITATGIAPHFDSESAILRTLAPGNYTVILRGKNNTTGIALLEVYNVP